MIHFVNLSPWNPVRFSFAKKIKPRWKSSVRPLMGPNRG